MSVDTYERSYVEVLEILKIIPETEYNKIPKEKIEFFNNNCDKEYHFVLDTENVNISRKAYAIIISLYKDFIANDKQKKIVDDALKYNTIKMENAKKEKYNIDVFYDDKEDKVEEKTNVSEENALIQVSTGKYSLLRRIVESIKNFFLKMKNK